MRDALHDTVLYSILYECFSLCPNPFLPSTRVFRRVAIFGAAVIEIVIVAARRQTSSFVALIGISRMLRVGLFFACAAMNGAVFENPSPAPLAEFLYALTGSKKSIALQKVCRRVMGTTTTSDFTPRRAQLIAVYNNARVHGIHGW